jgi:dihydrofolate reductase
MKMRVSLIAAVADNGVIGREGRLPWHISEDLRRFKRLTTGHTVIMGRRTWESLAPGVRPLPNRRNIVLSRRQDLPAAGALVCGSLEDALVQCRGEDEVFIIGGGEVYRQAIARADRLYLTLVHEQVDGDAHFPGFDRQSFREISREEGTQPVPHSYVVLDRKTEAAPQEW